MRTRQSNRHKPPTKNVANIPADFTPNGLLLELKSAHECVINEKDARIAALERELMAERNRPAIQPRPITRSSLIESTLASTLANSIFLTFSASAAYAVQHFIPALRHTPLPTLLILVGFIGMVASGAYQAWAERKHREDYANGAGHFLMLFVGLAIVIPVAASRGTLNPDEASLDGSFAIVSVGLICQFAVAAIRKIRSGKWSGSTVGGCGPLLAFYALPFILAIWFQWWFVH